MVTNIIQFFYPEIKKEEIKKLGLLGLTLFFAIGVYWLLRLLKDAVLLNLAFPVELGWGHDISIRMQPYLKIISPIFIVIATAIYSKLIDMFPKHKLFYIIISFYMVCFSTVCSVFLIQSKYGSAVIGKYPLAFFGMLNYLISESFGSLVIALFWSFTTSSTTTDQAKRGFPFIVAMAQIGSISGSSLLLVNLPTWLLFLIALPCMAGIMLTIKTLIRVIPKEEMKGSEDIATKDTEKKEAVKKPKPSILSGLRLLISEPYLFGIFIVSTFYEIAGTIIDYQMKSQAKFTPGIDVNWFLGIYGVAVNGLAFFMALLGTGYILKRFNIRICLLIYPVLFAAALIFLFVFYQQNPSEAELLWATFGIMMVVKGASYALNNPVKEMMYIPTSKDAKFKTKGFIDIFGNRAAKMQGAAINSLLSVKNNPALLIHNLIMYGTVISLGIIGVWIIAALYVGKKNVELVKNKQIIG